MTASVDSIVRIAARGDGVTADGRHAPFAAPGDTLNADGSVTPGPHHALPPCRHFPECGGCQLQHVDDAALSDYAQGRVLGALAGQGLPLPEAVRPTHLSPPRTRRRAELAAIRIGKRVAIGFHAQRSKQIIDMRECHVLDPVLFALVAPLRALLAELLPPRGSATVRLARVDQGAALIVAGAPLPQGLAAMERLRGFAEAQRLARLSWDEGYGAEPLWEPEPATVTLGGTVAVGYPPHAFLQATRDGEAALVAAVRDAVGDAAIIADLFAGLGTFALPLAGDGRRDQARVYAAEAARDAVAALSQAANRAGRAVFAEHRDLYRRPLTIAELDRFDAVVLDPPRAGAEEQVRALSQANVARIAYVSCNPVSFARDARILADGGWRIAWVQPVGQFRWSTHVELAALLVR